MKYKFAKALENNDILEMRKILKSDLHNHGTRGGNKIYIEEWAGISIPNPPKFRSVLNMSINIDEASFYDNSVEDMVQALKRIHKDFAPDVIFVPEVAVNTFTPMYKINLILEQFFDQNYFKSLDMYGEEEALCNFKKIFKIAKEKGLILKAHV